MTHPRRAPAKGQDCHTQYTVTSCADGYQDAIGLFGDCTVECSQSTDCIDCGACPFAAIHVVSDASHEEGWPGMIYSFSSNSIGCACHTSARPDSPIAQRTPISSGVCRAHTRGFPRFAICTTSGSPRTFAGQGAKKREVLVKA